MSARRIIKHGTSLKEKKLYDFICSLYNGDIVENDRTILEGKELDVYIPEKNFAIEFNGTYWHSTKMKKDMHYHQNKTLKCNSKGIRLIHVFEYEWDVYQDNMKAMIKHAFDIFDEEIDAYSCSIKPIDVKFYKEFLKDNCLAKSAISSIRYGMFYKNELVAVIGFGKSRFQKGEIELQRYAYKNGYNIIHGLERMIEYSGLHNFYRYIDLAHYSATSYAKYGFENVSLTEPNYKWVKGTTILNRFSTQKHKLEELLEDFNPDLTENENMDRNGYTKVYDAGNFKVRFTK